MSRKCILVFAILFSILFITQKNLPNEPAGTTLHESILLGLEKAEEWSNNAKPAFVIFALFDPFSHSSYSVLAYAFFNYRSMKM